MKINTISLKSCQILFQELNFPSEFITRIYLFLVFPKKWMTLQEKEKFYNSKHKKISVACYIWNRKKTQNIEDFLKLKHFIWSLKSKSKKIISKFFQNEKFQTAPFFHFKLEKYHLCTLNFYNSLNKSFSFLKILLYQVGDAKSHIIIFWIG